MAQLDNSHQRNARLGATPNPVMPHPDDATTLELFTGGLSVTLGALWDLRHERRRGRPGAPA